MRYLYNFYIYKIYLLRHLGNCQVKVALDVKNEWYICSRLYQQLIMKYYDLFFILHMNASDSIAFALIFLLGQFRFWPLLSTKISKLNSLGFILQKKNKGFPIIKLRTLSKKQITQKNQTTETFFDCFDYFRNRKS